MLESNQLPKTMTHIQHLATGGTIDSVWNPEQDTAVSAATSTSALYLDWMTKNGLENIVSETILLKDSRMTTIADRDNIADKIAESNYDKILVTTGTFLMADIARDAMEHSEAEKFESQNKRVVFTGSLIPIEGFEMSDAPFNLGMACSLFQNETLSPDQRVIATVNGICVPGDQLRKDLTSATFSGSRYADDLLGYDNFALISLGGTIDFEPDGLDKLIPATTSIVPSYLRNNVRIGKKFEATKPIIKDSRNLEDADIDRVIEAVLSSREKKILVTMGLIRINEVQKKIEKALKENNSDAAVVITGSKYPLRMAGMSDAPFNLGFALGVLGFTDKGVKVALAGKVYGSDENPLDHVYSTEERQQLTT